MRKWPFIYLFSASILLLFILHACRKKDAFVYNPSYLNFTTPAGWPAPVYNFDSNRITQEGFELGRRLFYDPQLSIDNTISCGSCHQQFAAFTHADHPLAHGINNQSTTRNPLGLFNLAWKASFHQDGGINHLDLQPLAPITAPNEMGESISNVLNKLKRDTRYPAMFQAAFGDPEINTQRMNKALSQFMLMLVSANSKYDKVMRGETSFTLPEQLGYAIFKDKCATCHKEPLFTDMSYRNNGAPIDPFLKDIGRMGITKLAADSLKFIVPSLRNIAYTNPYGHDGRWFSLQNVFTHYTSEVVNGGTTDPLLRNRIALTNFEIGQLQAFLFTLSDTSFVKDPRFAEVK
jgi:cytochrome c peroxidase